MAELKAYRKKYLNKLVKPAREEYVLTLKSLGTVSAEDIIGEAADHCRLQKADLRAAFDAIIKSMVLYLKVGMGVQLPEIGSLQPSIRANAVATVEECTQATLKGTGGVKINMQPIGEFKKAVDSFNIRIVKSAVDDTPVDATENEQPAAPGGEPSEPVKYRITFKFQDGTEDDHEYAEGATISYPTNTSGYRWPNTKPTVMPSHAVTVTEELITAPGGAGDNMEL